MFQPNSIIAGRYQVIRLVGQGGMSNLYLAYDRKYSNAVVVVKEMTASYSDPKEQQMAVDLFHREAKLLASLKHRHIPRVFDYFQFAGKYYLSMEFIDGEDLAVRLEANPGPLDETQVLEWGEQIATVLFYLHKHDPPIVFRDVKPSNIMITEKGIKLIDFGIARHFDQAKKGDTMRIGSPGYAPPEQYAAQTDPRSDIYALGVTLHHALTGRDPTATNTPFLVPPAKDLNPKLSEATAALLARATQLDPSDRYQNVLELKKDIKHILSRGKQSTRVVGAPPALPQADSKPSAPSAKTTASATSSAASPTPAATAITTPTTASNSAAKASHPSGSLTASTVNASSAPSTAAQPAASTPTPKKRRPFATLLLVSLVAMIGLGITGLGLSEEYRSLAEEKVRTAWTTLTSSFSREQLPEVSLSEAILTGDTQALLSLLESDELQALIPEKQELYRLNLMAKAINPENIRVLHVIYPLSEVGTQREREIWSVSAIACKSVNSAGGLDRQLLVVLPVAVGKERLESEIKSLSERFQSQVHLLVVGQFEEPKKDPEITNLLFLDGNIESSGHRISDLQGPDAELGELFESELKSQSQELYWSAGGKPPSLSAKNSSPPETESETLKLLEEAEKDKLTVVLQASQASGLENSSSKTKLLLLAPAPAQLPLMSPGSQAEALVSWSPFDTSQARQPKIFPGLAPSTSWTQARLYDALILATLPQESPYSGVSLNRDKSGAIGSNKPTRYRWSGSSWTPLLTTASKDPS